MGENLFFAIFPTEDQFVDQKLNKLDENEAKVNASYLIRTVARLVARIDHNQQLKFVPKTLQQ